MKVGKCDYNFNNPFRNTNLRLSSLHFAISSGVSNLILLVPGAWLCSQDTNKNINKSNEKKNLKSKLITQKVVGLTFFQWMLTIFSWAMKVQSGTEH